MYFRTGRHGSMVEKTRATEAARDELREALAAVDVVLPSLGVDSVSLTSKYLAPLVELGAAARTWRGSWRRR